MDCMKLMSMKLENFQGAKSLSLNFDGHSASIYGDNGTGKTTVYNALTWLLFDKASTGAKEFSPKTKGADGNDLHHLNHGVTALFETDSGERIAFQKVYHEVYKKKRGSAQEERDGHTVDYFVNGVPTKEKDYTATITSLCGGDSEKPKMLTMPDYFAEKLPWKTRREILLDMCGKVTDADVIKSRKELGELPELLAIPGTSGKMYEIDEFRKIATARLKKLNEQLVAIPNRIDEAEKAIPDVSGLDSEKVGVEIKAIGERIITLQEQRARASLGDTHESDIRKKIADLENQISDCRLAYMQMCHGEMEEQRAKILEAEKNVSEHKMARIALESELQIARAKLEAVTARRNDILKEWRRVNAETLSDASTICPTCGREFPADKLEKIKDDFNLSKSRRLVELNRRGKTEASKDMIAELTEKVRGLELKVRNESDAIDNAIVAYSSAKDGATSVAPFESTSEYKNLYSQISALRIQLNDSSSIMQESLASFDVQIEAARARELELSDMMAKIKIAELQKARIGQLEDEENHLSEEYNDTEHGLYLCDVFTREKVNMLTDKINQRFKKVRFRLFETQQNGGLKEGCDVMVPTDSGRLVPYSSANNAARVNAGLEIIDTLSEYWGVKLPVMVDNAESITRLENVNTQVIRLVVSEADKSLRLEVEVK